MRRRRTWKLQSPALFIAEPGRYRLVFTGRWEVQRVGEKERGDSPKG